MPSAAAIAVSIVAAGAAGASTLEGSPASGDTPSYRGAVAAFSAGTASTHPLPSPAPPDRVRTRPTPVLSSAAIPSDSSSSKPAPKSITKAPVSRSLAQRGKAAAGNSGSAGWTCAIVGCGGTFTSPFGGRWGRVHAGDDFATPVGTPLHALHSATVVKAGFDSGLGNHIELDLGNGIHAEYGHMSVLGVAAGQKLVLGQTIGLSGNTGHSTGPHLHLEIHLAGKPVDPAPWLKSHGIF